MVLTMRTLVLIIAYAAFAIALGRRLRTQGGS